MSITAEELKTRITSMYPEIGKYGLVLEVTRDQENNAWLVSFSKGKDQGRTHLELADAEGCMAGQECVHLGVQIGQFVKNYCEGGCSCRT